MTKNLLIKPKQKEDFELVIALCERLGIPSEILLNEEDEDTALLNAMNNPKIKGTLSEKEKENFINKL